MEARENILISGGTGTGKTTVLNALADLLPPDDRVILIEDTAELQLEKPNLVRFEARREQPERAGRHDPGPPRRRRSDTGRTASSWARSVAGKRSTCCRR